jgi:hypothetical protein
MKHFLFEDVILSLNCEKKDTTVLVKLHIRFKLNRNCSRTNVAIITT